MWALFKENIQISKEYPHKLQAVIHAFEQGLAFTAKGQVWLAVDLVKKGENQ